MKRRVQENLRLPFVLLVVFLLAAGCADIFAPPESSDSQNSREAGRVVITVANPARTIAPRLDQFSRIEITFQRKDESGTLSPLAVTGGTAVIYLPPGTWELTASAYNHGDPPAIVAQAKNILIRTGGVIAGEANFALEPTGTGSGTVEYAIALPPGLGISSGWIRVEQDGEALEDRAVDGETNGVFSLERGRYIVDILLDRGNGTAAAYREAAVILPGLVTVVDFSPAAEDFLDPEARAALTALQPFKGTSKNSSRTNVEEAGGEGAFLTQCLSAPKGTASVYFVLRKGSGQTVTLGGLDAAKVSAGAADGEAPNATQEVFTVDTSDIVVGDRVFNLVLAELYKENVVITVTVTIGYIQTLSFASLPNKRIYIRGENFDPAGLTLGGTYSDGGALAEPDLSSYSITGFDSSSVGEKTLQASVRGKNAGSFTITVKDADYRDLYFDYGIRRSASDTQPNRYSVPLGRTLALAPVKWHIPDDAVYEWKVDGEIQTSSATEYFRFTPEAQKSYAVTVTVKVGGTDSYTASTTVECVAPEGTHKRPATDNSTAEKFYHMPAPGQHTGNGGVHSGFNCCGAWGGYIVYKFDHSVERGSGKELGIGGNAFGAWSEPGVVWVMQDENGDGLPNDAWYELAGSHTLNSQTKRRYAVTYTQGAGWIDNFGGMGIPGSYPSSYPNGAPSPMTFVGTGLPGHYSDPFTGYVDANCEQRYSIKDAIQVDGSSIYLSYIDFVKVQTSLNIWAYQFGEVSTEIYSPPQDMSGPPDPSMLLTGASAGSGQYSYQFINNSGYSLTITLGTEPEFVLNAGGNTTKTIPLNQAYFDFYGGNVTFERATGKVTFTDRPE